MLFLRNDCDNLQPPAKRFKHLQTIQTLFGIS